MERSEDEIPEIEELERSVYDYFTSVLVRIRDEFEDDEDKEIYFRNVFKSMDGHEVQLVCHRRLSHGIEELLSRANEEQLTCFMDKLEANFLLISKHPNGSHVLQSILELCLKHSSSKASNGGKKDHDKLIKAVVKFGMLARENLGKLLNMSPSCHVICTLLEVLSGCKVSDHILKSKKTQRLEKKDKDFGKTRSSVPFERIEVPEEFLKVLKKIADSLIKSSDLSSIVAKSFSSLVLQTALLVLSNCNSQTVHKLVGALIPILFADDTDVMDSMSNCNLTPLIEKVIETALPDQFSSIWENKIKGKLGEIVIHPVANYVGQTLFRSCPTKKELEDMFDQLETSWRKVLEVGYLGILVAFSSACARLLCCQAKFVQLLTELLLCTEKRDLLVSLVLRWPINESSKTKNTSEVNYHGSLIIQNLLRFQKPTVVTDGLLNMDTTKLQLLFCEASGSHILDAYVESPTVGDKKRKLLAEKLKGHFFSLACNKYGSRCIENLWKCMDIKIKTTIIEELAENDFKLRQEKFGKIIRKSFGVHLFKNRPDDWQKWQTQGLKKQKMFNDILIGGGDKTKSKHKKRRFH